MNLLEIRNLTFEYTLREQKTRVVDTVSLTVNPGEILGVVGESGAGKSTIGSAIMGLISKGGTIVEGEIRLNGRRIDNLGEADFRALRGQQIGMIFQDPQTSLDPLQTVGQQLIETIRAHLAVSHKDARQRAIEFLDKVGVIDAETRIDHYPHQFSGGMRQRVVIALALCAEPKLIIADEPTTALDVSVQAQILDLMRKLCRETGVGMILITHDMGVISELSDRVAVMYRGKLVETGKTTDVLSRPTHPYSRSLMSAVPPAHTRLRRFPLVEYIEAAAKPPEGQGLAEVWPERVTNYGRAQGPLVKCENLSIEFLMRDAWRKSNRRYLNAVDSVNLEINEGEVLGLVGESGSGKSTIARLICGLYAPTRGRVLFDGKTISDRDNQSNMRAIRPQMQMIFQDPFSSLNPRMQVQDIIAEPIAHHNITTSQDSTQKLVFALLDQVGLGRQAATRFPHQFSGGQRQRISIARALATRPRFLICDEPTSALDVSIQAQILNLLKDLREELDLTLLFISHDLPVVRQMCDRVCVMRHGAICETAETDTLFERPEHEYSRHLLDLMPRAIGLSADHAHPGGTPTQEII